MGPCHANIKPNVGKELLFPQTQQPLEYRALDKSAPDQIPGLGWRENEGKPWGPVAIFAFRLTEVIVFTVG